MKPQRLFPFVSAACVAVSVYGAPEKITERKVVRESPPVFTAPSAQPATNGAPTAAIAAAPTSASSYQAATVSGRPPLVSREQAQAIVDRFKRGYSKLGAPRIVLYVNRELVDESGGIKLAERREKTDTVRSDFTADPTARAGAGQLGANVTVVGNVHGDTGVIPGKGTTERVTAENTFKQQDPKAPTLADRQTVRDVERLFGRPLRTGGARLADQRVASQVLEGHKVQDFLVTAGGSANATRDREALMKVADVVVEVLISSRSLTVPAVSGDAVYQAPDIQATAVRLADSQILGQASATDILGPDRYAGRVVRNYDIREITEATALALMEDMMQGVE